MAAEDVASADPPRPSGNAESQQWAIQRRIDDVFAKLGEKFGNLTGRVVAQMKPETTFAEGFSIDSRIYPSSAVSV